VEGRKKARKKKDAESGLVRCPRCGMLVHEDDGFYNSSSTESGKREECITCTVFELEFSRAIRE